MRLTFDYFYSFHDSTLLDTINYIHTFNYFTKHSMYTI